MSVTDNLRKLAFSARKLRLNVPSDALVLEVGSGDSPCPRSDVLFELTLDSFERAGGKTIVDRPLVLGNVEKLPFPDKSFGYVIAFHVLEHMARPELFLSELQRVASAGYLETPSFWSERVNPLTMHRLEVGVEPYDGRQRLVIQRKRRPDPDPELTTQFRRGLVPGMGFDRLHPHAWVTRYWWKDQIDYRVVNPEEIIEWPELSELAPSEGRDPRTIVRRVLKSAALCARRSTPVSLSALLRCTDCGADPLLEEHGSLKCPRCERVYPVLDGIPHMYPKAERKAAAASRGSQP